ncbi:hypothetical protein Tco_0000892 [Tanacetum coccineum]
MLDDPYVHVALQAPPSPNYIPGPEESQLPPLPDFIPKLVYPEYVPQEDEVFPAEEQPLPVAASPTAQSPDYVPESDSEANLKEDDDEDEDESSEDDEDDDVDIEADDDEEEEEHPSSIARVARDRIGDTVMSDSDESTVTYTERPDVIGRLTCPRLTRLHTWPRGDHITTPTDFNPDRYIPSNIAEEQPLPAADSPTANSPGYIPESDPEEDPEEDDDEDPEEDPADYPADGGDDGDDEDEPSDDDEDEEVDIEADDEEEEEHPAPADSTTVALPAIDQAPSAEETKTFETDESVATPPPHPAYRVTSRISIPAPVPTPVWSDEEVARLLAISTPSSSPLSLWSSPLPQIPSPPLPPILSPLPVSSPVPVLSPSPPASPIRPLGYRAAMIRLRAEAASTSHSLPLPPPIILSYTRPDAPSSGTPPFYLLSTDRRKDRPEVTLPPRKRADYGFVATIDREIMRDLERDVGYGITDSWDEIVEAMQGTPVVTDVAEFS